MLMEGRLSQLLYRVWVRGYPCYGQYFSPCQEQFYLPVVFNWRCKRTACVGREAIVVTVSQLVIEMFHTNQTDSYSK